MYQYAYLVGDLLLFLPSFVLLFWWRKDLQREMLIAGATFSVIAFLTEPLFLRDYWHPEFVWPFFLNGMQLGSLEDFLYGFLKGGVAAVVFEEVARKSFSRGKVRRSHWKETVSLMYVGCTALFILPIFLWGWNSLYTGLLSVVVLFGYLLLYRRDLLVNAFVSGVLMVGISFVGFMLFVHLYPGIIESWWKLENLSGILVLGLPVEELLESFAVGFFGGPLYEFFNGLRLKNKR